MDEIWDGQVFMLMMIIAIGYGLYQGIMDIKETRAGRRKPAKRIKNLFDFDDGDDD